MKKLITILLAGVLIILLAPTVQAQSRLVSRYSVTLDTVTNTGLKSMTSPLRVTGPGQSVSISTVNTLLTGTLSGVARLWGSIDGTNYNRVRSTALHGGQVDSLLVGPNTKTYTWLVDNNPYQYYQIQTTGIGTVTFTVQGSIVKH